MRQKVQLSERALFGRVNRALQREGQSLRRCRIDSRDYANLGRYFVVDDSRNYVVGKDIDLEELAREVGVLRGYETLAQDA
ncbi:MAG: hypothetical protein KIT54_07070 [Phycisphaeraceae bacterium]|nr:hypothetical protein [Phycisphaeraceae bacterium]